MFPSYLLSSQTFEIPQSIRHRQFQRRYSNDLSPLNQYFPPQLNSQSNSHPFSQQQLEAKLNCSSKDYGDRTFLDNANEQDERESFSKFTGHGGLFDFDFKNRDLSQKRFLSPENDENRNSEDRHRFQRNLSHSPTEIFSECPENTKKVFASSNEFDMEKCHMVDLCRAPNLTLSRNVEKVGLSLASNSSILDPKFENVKKEEFKSKVVDLYRSPILKNLETDPSDGSQIFENVLMNGGSDLKLVDQNRTPIGKEFEEIKVDEVRNSSEMNHVEVGKEAGRDLIQNRFENGTEFDGNKLDYEKFFEILIRKTENPAFSSNENQKECKTTEVRIGNRRAVAFVDPNAGVNFINPEFLYEMAMDEKIDILKWGFESKNDLTGLPYEFASYQGQKIPVYGLINIPIDIGDFGFETSCMVTRFRFNHDLILREGVSGVVENIEKNEPQPNPIETVAHEGQTLEKSVAKIWQESAKPPIVNAPEKVRFVQNKKIDTIPKQWPKRKPYFERQSKSRSWNRCQFCPVIQQRIKRPRVFVNSKYKKDKSKDSLVLRKRPPSLFSIKIFPPFPQRQDNCAWKGHRNASHAYPFPQKIPFQFKFADVVSQPYRTPTTMPFQSRATAQQPCRPGGLFVNEGGGTSPNRFAGAQLVGAGRSDAANAYLTPF